MHWEKTLLNEGHADRKVSKLLRQSTFRAGWMEA